ncbi:MAG: type IV pilus modification protein PilV [Magnetococcales bacterium]|nr:type IV pilus modification protein PilV [Magnetococcales bacterium]
MCAVNKTKTPPARIAPEAGFSLLEILIALLILSVGLLGLGTLQLASLRTGQEAYFRDQATAIAQELAERLHVNPTGAANQSYDLSKRSSAPFSYAAIDCTQNLAALSVTTFPTTRCGDDLDSGGNALTAIACTPDQLAEFDAYQVYCQAWGWNNPASEVGRRLPGLQISVACNAPCTTTSAQTITVSWKRFGWKTLAADAACPADSECLSVHVVP